MIQLKMAKPESSGIDKFDAIIPKPIKYESLKKALRGFVEF